MNKTKFFVVGLITLAIASYFVFDLGQYLSLGFIQSRLASIEEFKNENFALTVLIYFVGYVAVAALSIPGAVILTLLGGAVFGVLWGTLIVSFASSIGATLAFLVSRLLLRDWVQAKFGDYLGSINKGIEKDGDFYLFSIRMVPLFPFFMVNLLMGLTPIRATSFYLVSQLGMLIGTGVYVNAGSELSQISSLSGLVSAPVVLSFVVLGLFPLVAKFFIDAIQRNKIMKKFTRPKKFDANVVVIGAGSAGLVVSLIVAGAKAKVILIEKHKMGGDCLNTGCVPSKAIIRSGRIMSYIRRAKEFGIEAAEGRVNFAQVMGRVQGIIKTIEPHDSVERFTSLGVECISGDARIESPYTVSVNGRRINTRAIVLATGARPLVPPIPGLDQIDYLTSDSIWSLRELPARLLIVGGGPIGCELAQAFSNLGSQVTQVDMAERIMPREDEEVSKVIMQAFERQGIKLLTAHKVLKFGLADGVQFMEAQHEGKTVRVEFDKVLLAIGRKANVEGFGLEELELALNPQGTVEVNEYLQTSYPNIYACGDVAGPYQFTHMASFQAWFASLNAMLGGLWRSKINYNVVPWATFTDPEVARVGLSEQEAIAENIAYEVTRYEMDDHDRSLADGEAHGFVKILTVPGKDKILGVTIVGYHAGEQIGEFVFAMTHGMGLGKISAVTHIYPTLSEANKFAANAWRNARLPVKYFPLAEKFFRWRRG
ncbi:MAG: pyridine nucleotide-disulfide oxidoreductase [SAR86 cluster bacterium]|uniref:Pyridine nucleotide-disulfide oxidoreductase n=1 Tax=SAR86 cluster bacterium TaxID=2030880 RepID=A0A2A5BA96_9GAMM|nr:MAG: pyridine nucleotide-disulfide oxidoreductase [SAR86 cluster bacterium]